MHESTNVGLFGQPKPREVSNWRVAAIWLGLVALFAWVFPRLYQPNYIEIDPLDSRVIWHVRRQWFGPDLRTRLEARRHADVGAMMWMARDKDGSWWPYFWPSQD